MKSIKLTDQELDSMIQMYTAELEEAQMYIKHLQDILDKLEAAPLKAAATENEPKVAKKRGRKPSVKPVEKAEPKKRGRKPKTAVIATPDLPVAEVPVKKVKKAKVADALGSLVDSLVAAKPAKKEKAPKKKSTPKRKAKGFVSLVNLSKPLGKKESKVKPAVTVSPSETPAEHSNSQE